MVYVWILVFVCHQYYWGDESEFNLSHFLCVIGMLSMSLGFWSTYRNSSNKLVGKSLDYSPIFFRKFIKYFLLVEIIRLAYCIHIVVFNLAGGAWLMLINEGTALRNAYLSYEPSIIEKVLSFSTNLLSYIGYVILGIYTSKKYPNTCIYLSIVCIFELLLSIITMSKLSFSLFILTIFISYLNSFKTVIEQKKKLKLFIPIAIVILFSFFIFIGFQRNYMETRGSLQEGVFDGVINYFGGPLEALDRIIAKGFGLVNNDHGMIDIERTETNVYTWFYYFHKSIPYLGFIIFPFVIGLLSGKLYRPWKNSLFNDITNSWVCVFIAFSFFDLLIKFTVFQLLFVVVWCINKRYSNKIYIYDC